MLLRQAGCKALAVALLSWDVASIFAQSEPKPLTVILGEEILAPSVSLFQLKEYLLRRVAKPPAPTSAQQWTTEGKQLRERLLKVAFSGWPEEWVNSSPKLGDLGIIKGGVGYRMR